jgi:hypothetical protein
VLWTAIETREVIKYASCSRKVTSTWGDFKVELEVLSSLGKLPLKHSVCRSSINEQGTRNGSTFCHNMRYSVQSLPKVRKPSHKRYRGKGQSILYK